MKILYILPSLANTAPIQIALALVQGCVNKGYYVEVNYFDDICELTFPCVTKQIRINKSIEFDEFDIIHSHMRRPDKYIAKFSREIQKAKTVSTIHCDIFQDLKYSYGYFVALIYTKLWIRNLRKFDCTVQVSEFLMKKYKKSLGNNFLIHNGVSVNKQNLKEYDGIKETIVKYHKAGYKVLLSYSNIIKRKGLLQIIDALKYKKDLAYVCIGEGSDRVRLEREAKNQKLMDRVSFFDFINYPYNLVPYVDIVVVPSYSESFCLALHEAGIMGASVVCSRISAFTDAFSDNEVTFFELNNTESLIEAIDIALSESKQNNLSDKEARLYTRNIMIEKYVQLYKEL